MLAYGNARDLVTGLEVALADGEVLDNLSKLRKDNTGYDLKHVFMGSEGTLGVITAAVLKLYPRPRSVESPSSASPARENAWSCLTLAQRMAGPDLKTFEFMSRFGVEIVVETFGRRARAARGAHALVCAAGAGLAIGERPQRRDDGPAGSGFRAGIVEDAAVAASLDQRNAFWALRENLSEMQKFEGGSIKHDVSVPVPQVPAFLAEALPVVEATIPAPGPCLSATWATAISISTSASPSAPTSRPFSTRWEELNDNVHAVVAKYHGSISAEHGIGVLKRDLLPTVKDPVAMDVMRRFKKALDPNKR